VACHSPHTASGSKMLTGDVREVCLRCHDPGGADSGAPGHFASHGELACNVCHGPHGAEQPLLLIQDPIRLCGACHEHQHSVTHPLGEATLDPRNGQPIDCLSCHGIHDAPYPKYLLRGGDRELCVGCHTELAGRGG
jgi:predicted CXXCH cytochrome family protein